MLIGKENKNPEGVRELRSRIYWTLLAFAVGPIVYTIVSIENSHLDIFLSLVALPVAALLADTAAGYIMKPIYSLELRLSHRNYGPRKMESVNQVDDKDKSDRNSDWLPSFVKNVLAALTLLNLFKPDIAERLPPELASIEKLSRAGRIADIALDSVKKDLFRHLSHQLKSPMAQLMAHSQMARKRCAAGDQTGINENLSAIEEVSKNVARLVEQLLSMAWVESLENVGVGKSVVNLSNATMRVVQACLISAVEKDIAIHAEVQAGLWVEGDETLLQEMVSSILENAIRYSPKKSVITLVAKHLSNGRAIAVTISDQGPGIPAAERERVFEPFYGSIGLDDNGNMTYGTRRHRVIADGLVRTSHGLGLSLVRSIARLHNINVTLSESPSDTGLKVCIALSAATSRP